MSPVEILPLFSTPIYKAHTGINSFSEELKFLENMEYQKGVENGLSKNKKLLDFPELNNIKSICEAHLKKYVDTVLNCNQEFYITNSWTTKNSKNDSHHLHDHQNSIVSGVIYLQVPDPQSGINFIYKSALKKNFYFHYTVREYNIFNSDSWTLPIEQGQIIIFPSWLYHSVPKNTTDRDRISLAFNTFVRGKFGEGIYSGDLEL